MLVEKNNATKKFTTQTDTIFFYSKNSNAFFSSVFIQHSKKEIKNEYKYMEDGRQYRLSRGRNYQITGEQRKLYLDESRGRAIGNLWNDEGLQLNTSSSERTGYPTQKTSRSFGTHY